MPKMVIHEPHNNQAAPNSKYGTSTSITVDILDQTQDAIEVRPAICHVKSRQANRHDCDRDNECNVLMGQREMITMSYIRMNLSEWSGSGSVLRDRQVAAMVTLDATRLSVTSPVSRDCRSGSQGKAGINTPSHEGTVTEWRTVLGASDRV